MRTKIAFLSAVTLVAGLLSASAQVYSVNIVGYVNVPVPGQAKFSLLANPLDDGNGNQISNLLATLPNKSSVTTWGGTVYNAPLTKSSGVWPAGTLPPGVGFFLKNGVLASPDITNTFVGEVLVDVGQSTTNALILGNSLVGSQIPFAGSLATNANLALGALLPNKSSITTWNVAGQVFDAPVTKAAGVWPSPVNVSVAQGFFVNSKAATNWVQTLP